MEEIYKTTLFLCLITTYLTAETSQNDALNLDDGQSVQLDNGKLARRIDDLILSEAQGDWLFGTDANNTRFKRAGTKPTEEVLFWPGGVIHYRIERAHFNDVERLDIREAMDVWEKMTCLKFEEKTSTMQKQWVYIVHTGKGCYSLLGMATKVQKGPQPLSLQDPGCRHFGTYLHELGHAIGLVHEHQLPSREKYIHYYMSNVDPTKANQLEMYAPNIINTYNTPYDLGSIMHYGVISFSVDDTSPTLGVDDPYLEKFIGRRYSNLISFGDARTVNRLYQCAKHCPPAALQTCRDPGYLDKDCKCISPIVYQNQYCKDEAGMDEFCNSLVPTGKCDIKNILHHKYCARACDFCPKFLPGQPAIGPAHLTNAKRCLDRYHTPLKCQHWKQFCAQSPWMHRNCRATCGACGSKIGDCSNTDYDTVCDKYAVLGLCSKETKLLHFIRARCGDSCGTCGYRKDDKSCSNVAADNKCQTLAGQGACERNPLLMFQQCPSTCNRCYWNKGQCQNAGSVAQCNMWGLQNFCTHGIPLEIQYVREQCGKTCNSCASSTSVNL